MRPGPNYRMTKSSKIYLAVTWNRSNRRTRRQSIIQSELFGSAIIKGRRERES